MKVKVYCPYMHLYNTYRFNENVTFCDAHNFDAISFLAKLYL